MTSQAPASDVKQIDLTIHELFGDMNCIRHVCYSNVEEKYRLIVIFKDEDFESAFTAIDNKIIELEKLLPNIDIEPWILHVSEVHPDHLINTKTIFKKKDNDGV